MLWFSCSVSGVRCFRSAFLRRELQPAADPLIAPIHYFDKLDRR
jgi:hypothetical protein